MLIRKKNISYWVIGFWENADLNQPVYFKDILISNGSREKCYVEEEVVPLIQQKIKGSGFLQN